MTDVIDRDAVQAACPMHQQSESTKVSDDAVAPHNLDALPLPPLVEGGLPFIGRGLEVMKHPLKFMLKYEKELGDCYRFKVANREYFVLSNVDASEFAAKNGREYLKSGALWADFAKEWDMPNQMLGLDGEKHAKSRRLFKSKMSKNLAVECHQKFEEVTKKVVGELQAGQVESVRDLTRYLVNSLVSTAFNGSSELIDKQFAIDAIDWQTQTFNIFVLKKWPRLMKWRPSFKRKGKAVWDYVEKTIAEKTQNPGDDFASYVLELARNNPDLFETEGDLKFNIVAPLFAGADTVGTTSTFMLHELCFNPSLRERVTAAVDKAVAENGGAIPSPEFLKDHVPELYGLCMETLRLYPTAFSISRTATQSFAFKGYRIPKDSEVLVVTTAAHFDERFYKYPRKFDIDRYSAPREEHKARYAFQPYGVGTHVCLGAGFAELLFLTLAATIIYHFDFEVADPHREYQQIFDPSLGIETGFKIRMKGWRH
ncbi:cytochrome P450 [Spongiibacter sp. KMU-158]|uniref:Cytochrome P450 n=1 Tax=Spongiibacter pelagi TaxID=2760804 RepID=A0A927C1E3_9GAMM|nr:cytochrome P450 [Spongiibacter pelagi]MBD2858102.1 cytochrome P450 [Spongiibacter pelagi]